MLKDQIKDIVLSTWSYDYYKEGHTFTENGRDLDKAVDQLLQLFDKDKKELIERIKKRVRTYWYGKESTDWQLQTEYAKKLFDGLFTILEELGKEAGVV